MLLHGIAGTAETWAPVVRATALQGPPAVPAVNRVTLAIARAAARLGRRFGGVVEN